MLKTLSARQPTVHFGPAPQIRVRRLDNGEYPATLVANGKPLCVVKAAEELSISAAAGAVEMYVTVHHVLSTHGQYATDNHSFGRSEKITAYLRPFGNYVTSIDASNVYHRSFNLLTPLAFLGRKLFGLGAEIKYYDEKTWPASLRIEIDRVYSP